MTEPAIGPTEPEGGAPAFRTVLVPERQSLLPFAFLSAAVHLVGAGSIWGVTAFVSVLSAFVPMCAPPEPVLPALEVSVVSLPKSAGKVPDRAARVARASGSKAAETPPPVKQSDLALKTKAPEPEQKGNTEEARRQQLLDDLRRQQLLDELMDAPDGPVDRDATDPNGTDEAALAVLGAGARGDPAYARWVAEVQRLLMERFQPLATLTEGRPDLVCGVTLEVDPATGAIRSFEVSDPSGVLAFDQAAERAVQATPKLPPAPEKYRPLVARGVEFRFTPK